MELSRLKKAGQTYDELLEGLVEEYKKTRLFREMRHIEERGTGICQLPPL